MNIQSEVRNKWLFDVYDQRFDGRMVRSNGRSATHEIAEKTECGDEQKEA